MEKNVAVDIIDGKRISEDVKNEIKYKISSLSENDTKPVLAVVLVGEDPASLVYVKNIKAACRYTGVKFVPHELPSSAKESELVKLIYELNQSPDINGIIIQFPLPKHINEQKIISCINPDKDVDCLHPHNMGRLVMGGAKLLPCTPAGIVELIRRSVPNIEGMNCVVIGRSNIVGKPVATLLLAENATVTICHSKTKNLSDIASRADILVAAVGKPRFVTAEMVKDGAIVIDVGIHRLDGKLCGDVDFDGVAPKAGCITPVPGGVGPMTITMLMKNCLTAYEIQTYKDSE